MQVIVCLQEGKEADPYKYSHAFKKGELQVRNKSEKNLSCSFFLSNDLPFITCICLHRKGKDNQIGKMDAISLPHT